MIIRVPIMQQGFCDVRCSAEGWRVAAESVPWLLNVANVWEPEQVPQAMRALREAVCPDELGTA